MRQGRDLQFIARFVRSAGRRWPRFWTSAALAGAALLSGCAAFSPDAGMDVVGDIAARELKKDVVAIRSPEDAEFVRDAVKRLLGRTLTADAAVQITLFNNRGLQAAYNELALAEAEMVEGSLPPNPRISFLRIAGSAEIEIERRIVTDILALVTLPVRSEIALVRFRQAQLRAALETLRVAAETRRAYYRAVAAQELGAFLMQAQATAETATQLAARLGETGAMNKLDQAREQVFYADITAQVAAARQGAASEREALIRRLGVWDGNLEFKIPNVLPGLPRRPQILAGIEVEAVRRRVDLQISRMELDALAKAYGLTQATRFINILDAGYADKFTKDKKTGQSIRDRGFEIELQIPIFDFGEVRVRQAEQTYMQAVNRLVEKAVNVRSQARDAYRVYRSAYDIAGHYQREILPLRKIISDETLLRYNAMQIDVFALLVEARQRIVATIAAIDAKRNFWLATADLKAAVAGGGVSGGSNEGTRPMTESSSETGRH
jgi:outer membrane protein TolC